MQIIESFTQAKSGIASHNEDRIHVAGSFAVVADGVSSKDSTTKRGPSPGQLAADAVCDAVGTLPLAADSTAAFKVISAGVETASRRHGQMAASVIVYSDTRREIWSVGDCQYLAGRTKHRTDHTIDVVLGQLRAFVLTFELVHGANVESLLTHDAGRNAIHPFLRMQALFANSPIQSPFAYGVVNGTPVPERFIHVFRVPPDVDEIVLATDGYPELRPTLSESEACLARILSEDPLCYRHMIATKGVQPGSASFDDRAFLRLSVGYSDEEADTISYTKT